MGWFYKLLCSFNREDETWDWDPVGKYITAIFFKGQVALSKGPWVLDFTTPSRKSKGNQDGRARERGGKWGEKSGWGKGVALGPRPSTSAQSREDLSDMEANWKGPSPLSSPPTKTSQPEPPFQLSIFATLFTNSPTTTENCYVVRWLSSILSWLDDEFYLKLF